MLRCSGGTMNRIHVSEPILLGREREYVLDCLDRAELSGNGQYVLRFEEAFAALCGTRHAVACCNGTAALHMALLALNVQPGDRIIVPALTYIATANAVRYCGAEPVFCDVLPDTWCIDPVGVKALLLADSRIVGIIPVHLYGVPADMDALRKLALARHVWLLEDAAEAHGARVGGVRIGALGQAAAFSFFGNKLLTMGEGGAVTTSDDALVARVRAAGRQAQDPGHRYWHTAIGHNYRLGNVQAAIGLAQVEEYDRHAALRRIVWDWYERALEGSPFERQVVPVDAESANWMVAVLLPPNADPVAVMRYMGDGCGIETRPVFQPIPLMPPYREGAAPTPVAEDIAARGICLPTHGRLTQDDVAAIVLALNKATRASILKGRL
jgi:perosamine synthetase